MIRRGQNGFSLIEICVAIGIMGVMVAVAVPQFGRWTQAQRVRDASRGLARAFSFARTEAIRTGNNHIVFLQVDALGNALLDNTGLGVDDTVDLKSTNASCTDVAALETKGVSVSSDCP